jgi:Na+/melibiose symporter-like transporter
MGMSVLDAGSLTRTASAGLWRNRNFQWLFVINIVCLIGHQFSLVAMPWLALRLTGSPAVLATTLASMAIPQVLLILIGGATADRYSPRNILTVTNCANAVVLAALAIATACGLLRLPLLIALTVLLGTSAAFASPAGNSLLPRIVPPELLIRANSVFMMSRHIAMLIGPIAAGSLIAWVSSAAPRPTSVRFAEAMGISCALLMDAAAFLIAAWSIRFVHVPVSSQVHTSSMLRSVAEGLCWLWNDRSLRTLLIYYTAMMLLVTGPSQVAFRC